MTLANGLPSTGVAFVRKPPDTTLGNGRCAARVASLTKALAGIATPIDTEVSRFTFHAGQRVPGIGGNTPFNTLTPAASRAR